LILCYHGIADGEETDWNGDLFITTTRFAARMESLRQHHCSVLSLGEAIDRLYKCDLPGRAVVITFDDGFANFHSNALPILKRYGFPATVYVSTYYSEHADLPVFPVACSYLLWKARGQIRRGLNIPGVPGQLDLRTAAGRESAALTIINHAEAKDHPGKAKDELLSRLAAALGQDFDELRERRALSLMTPEEILRASRSGVSIEMHSRSHRIPNLRNRFELDLRRNADQIQEWTGVAPSHFCYPSGLVAPHWVEWLRDFPVKSAVTCAPAFASSTDDAMLLPRYVDVSRSSVLDFESWLSGFAPIVRRRAAMRIPAGAPAPPLFTAAAVAATVPLSPPVSTPPSDPARDLPMRSTGSASAPPVSS